MRLATFFESFDQFANAPDAVAKMRGLILRLAMQGRLSDPRNTDSPVSDLLREVARDRMRLGLEHTARFKSGLSDFSEDETADSIPARWAWVRFGYIASHNAGKTLDKGRNRGELRDYITTSNLYWGFFQLDTVRKMPMLGDEIERCTAIKGDLLICEGGEAGRAAVWPHDREISFQNHVHRARFFSDINPYFVQRYFEKLNATGEIEKYRKGVGISNMSGKALASIPVPLPPVAEQRRIVGKVDELMALCDRLEAHQQERETRRTALTRASLARFADAPTPANLDFTFHKSYDITPADLRKAILTLAVQGKLVPQDPNDEPASNLITRAREERRRLVEAGILKRVKPLNEDGRAGEFMELPSNWTSCRLDDIALKITDGEHATPAREDHGHYLLSARNVRDGFIDVANVDYVGTEEFERIRKRCDPDTGDILLSCSGSVGRVAVVDADNKYAMVRSAALIKNSKANVDSSYLSLVLRSPGLQLQIERSSRQSAQANLFIEPIRRLAIPLPPLAEQRRIVAKVEQMMALVDALEAQIAESEATASKLLEAAVVELTAQAPAMSTTTHIGSAR